MLPIIVGVLLALTACASSGSGVAGVSPVPSTAATSTPAATPTPTPVAPITRSGTGSKVTDPIPLAAGLWRVAWKADGTSNFAVKVHGQEERLLVNVILPNPSSGEAAFQSAGGRFVFEVEADQASWTITLTRLAG